MTREEFIEALDKESYRYEIVGNKIVVTAKGSVWGAVYLQPLKTLPPDAEFRNGGNVYLGELKTLPPGVVFRNVGYIYLGSLNGGDFKDWGGNIEGISPNRLLNKMIEIGLLDRR